MRVKESTDFQSTHTNLLPKRKRLMVLRKLKIWMMSTRVWALQWERLDGRTDKL